MRILVTGAAGLIGGEVCARLTRSGHEAIALVRRNREIRGNDRQEVAVAARLTGDIERPGLGLDDQARAALHDVDLVIHCAASLRFDLADADYDRTNVGGTANVMALAGEIGAGLLYVSTAFVCGVTDRAVPEGRVSARTVFANGYEASKARAEAVVRGSDVAFAIARPSIVVGDSATGAIRSYDALYTTFRLVAEGRISVLPVTRGATLDFVPIDHVARGIVALAEQFAQARGGTFHLVADAPLPLAGFADAIGSFRQFASPALVDRDTFDPRSLPPFERRLYRRTAALYASYFQRAPRFAASRLRSVTGLVPPPGGAMFMRRLMDFCIADNFLPGANEQVTD